MAQSGLARLTGGQKVAGSNPVAPTKNPLRFRNGFFFFIKSYGESLGRRDSHVCPLARSYLQGFCHEVPQAFLIEIVLRSKPQVDDVILWIFRINLRFKAKLQNETRWN